MFTGIVSAMGTISEAASVNGGRVFVIAAPWDDVALGESIAVDGACLTANNVGAGFFGVEVIATSLDRTAFAAYAVGRQVNLERALRLGDRLGGHLVQGHVDAVGQVVAVVDRDDARLVDIRVPDAVADVSIPLGSITVDGVSLTVNAIPRHGLIQVALIPFTLEHTTLGERRPGDAVHLEGDTVGKYVRQWVTAGRGGAERT
ncbi:MAG TPA: riboflavin synthase [Gemmatimonadales bacterium]|jgi:riboflavin synthase|nr:riboflavin synthase [Gemmatimonadales bacterium]